MCVIRNVLLKKLASIARRSIFLRVLVREELIEVIEQYNQDPLFHGILVQLPLPNHINEMRILLAIDPKKMLMVSIL